MARDKELIVTKPDDSDDEQYNEAEDEDFNPAQAEADEDVSSSEDEASEQTKKPSKKRKADLPDELDSGDEATIKERKTKKRRKHDDEDDSAEEGGLIKTRAQHHAEKVQRKQERKRIAGEVTVDVDQLWAELSTIPIGKSAAIPLHVDDLEDEENIRPPETIKIVRRIQFAGQVEEVEEEVPRDSEAAQTYLREQEEKKREQQDDTSAINKPLRRFSMFEPNPLGIVKGVPPDKLRRKAPTKLDMAMAERRAEDERKRKAEKLSTMQKTALDWKGFVIEQGLGAELDEYGKSKKGFLAREQFLDKVAGANEVARKTARLKA